jgi:hypothetical protein
MNLYKLERNPRHVAYDEVAAMIVAAEGPRSAREIAAEAHEDEAEAVWFAPNLSTCELVGVAADGIPAGLILANVQWG